jgi:hypothetical protein
VLQRGIGCPRDHSSPADRAAAAASTHLKIRCRPKKVLRYTIMVAEVQAAANASQGPPPGVDYGARKAATGGKAVVQSCS